MSFISPPGVVIAVAIAVAIAVGSAVAAITVGAAVASIATVGADVAGTAVLGTGVLAALPPQAARIGSIISKAANDAPARPKIFLLIDILSSCSLLSY